MVHCLPNSDLSQSQSYFWFSTVEMHVRTHWVSMGHPITPCVWMYIAMVVVEKLTGKHNIKLEISFLMSPVHKLHEEMALIGHLLHLLSVFKLTFVK